MNEEKRCTFKDFFAAHAPLLAPHRGKLLGVLVGLFLGTAVLLFGFWQTLFGTIFELKVSSTNIFAPFKGLHNPSTILEIWFTWLSWLIIFNPYAFVIHANRIMAVTTDNHIECAFI